MTGREVVRHVAVVGLAASVLGVPVALPAQSTKPNYLPFVEFSPADTQAQIDVKKAYNDAAEGYNRILYDYHATIEDPKVFTRPWKISLPLYRLLDKNAQLLEFKCVEFVEELMYRPLLKRPAK